MSTDRAREVKKRHEVDLLQVPGVVSIGVSEDEQGLGIIIVGMDGGDRARIPDEIEDIPVFVRDEDSPQLASYRPTSTLGQQETGHRDRIRPVRPGTSMQHADGGACTGNFIFEDPDTGEVFVGSNNHCFVNINEDERLGGPVLQPAPNDGGRLPADFIGSVKGYLPFVDGTSVDFSWAKLTRADYSTYVRNVGRIDGPPKNPRLFESVAMSGRTSGVVTGIVDLTDVSVVISHRKGSTVFTDLFRMSNSGTNGDSGSPVVSLDGGIRPVGVNFTTNGLCCKITNILDQSGLEIVTIGEDQMDVVSCNVSPENAQEGELVDIEATFQNVTDSPIIFDMAVEFENGKVTRTLGNVISDDSTETFTHSTTAPSDLGRYTTRVWASGKRYLT